MTTFARGYYKGIKPKDVNNICELSNRDKKDLTKISAKETRENLGKELSVLVAGDSGCTSEVAV